MADEHPSPAPDKDGQDDLPVSALELARHTLECAIQAVAATAALLRAEVRLAGASALTLVWMGFLLTILAFGAWLGINAVIIAAVFAWSGSVLLGTAAVFFVNAGGAVVVAFSMKRCWRDITLPRTRALITRQLSDRNPTNQEVEQ